MNEELDYAEMLEIPVETVTVKHKERRRRAKEPDLRDQLVEQVNDRMEEPAPDPAYAESREIEREVKPNGKQKLAKRLILGEFIAACALCAVIFLTNIFMTNSAINTWVRGLVQGSASAADTRVYSDFTLSSVVRDEDTDIAVSGTGVLSFTAQCFVYAPCEDGTVSAIYGDEESGYTVELAHSDTFTSIVSGLRYPFVAEGDVLRHDVALGYSDGTREVRVMFYEGDELLNCCVVGEDGLAWS